MSVQLDVVPTFRVRDGIMRDMFKVIVRVRERLHVDARAIAHDRIARANIDCEVRSGQKFWDNFFGWTWGLCGDAGPRR